MRQLLILLLIIIYGVSVETPSTIHRISILMYKMSFKMVDTQKLQILQKSVHCNFILNRTLNQLTMHFFENLDGIVFSPFKCIHDTFTHVHNFSVIRLLKQPVLCHFSDPPQDLDTS